MQNNALTVLQADHYWLANAHIPRSLLVDDPIPGNGDLAHVDVEVQNGVITQLISHGSGNLEEVPALNWQRGQIWSCFVDMHTHLDKGHIWERSPNRSGTFHDALTTVHTDRETRWQTEDVYRRMEFGLKCSYAHGTRALRTHIDALGKQAEISLEVVKTLQQQWGDRLALQAVSLLPLDCFLGPEGEKLADRIAEVGGVLGGLALMSPELDTCLDRVLTLARERNLPLDFHTDESGNPTDMTLRHVAAAVLRHEFPHTVVCGHCCSLAVQDAATVAKTIGLVKEAGIGIVSLPMCNLFLQDRNQVASHAWISDATAIAASSVPSQTPRWRGVTLVHELKHSGIPVAFASDNCRDPFYGYGDHDVLEVFTQATRIAHLDAPYGDWCRSVTTTPADLLGYPTMGRIGIGLTADLVLFKARYFSELLSRHQGDRLVLRQGKPIDSTLPDYAELDDLLS